VTVITNPRLTVRFGEGVTRDYAEALKWYRKAAEQGEANAQSNLGVMYHEGEGTARDYAEAVKWWRKAAEQGHADAQNNLGVMYAAGSGVA
jgi:TPR repeat protein